jgi:hypothetical protein
MLMFGQILPPLFKIGAASPQGLYETAKQIIEEMGFNNADKFLGVEAGQIATLQGQQQTQALMETLPLLLGKILEAAKMPPEMAAKITQTLMAGLQQTQQQPLPEEQQSLEAA